MASTNFKKFTQQEIAGIGRHFDLEKRATQNHSNPDIDKDKVSLDYNIGCKDWAEAYAKLKQRTKEVDEEIPPKRVRKDRVVAVMLETPCPRIITDMGRSDEFFKMLHEEECKFFGKENVHGGFVHKDEVHEYLDRKHNEMRLSCEHKHDLISPYTKEYGINGKHFVTRERMKEWNDYINEKTKERFGVELNTHEAPGREKTEKLKLESTRAEAEILCDINENQRNEIKNNEKELNEQKQRKDEIENETIEFTKKAKDLFDRIDDKIEELTDKDVVEMNAKIPNIGDSIRQQITEKNRKKVVRENLEKLMELKYKSDDLSNKIDPHSK